MAGCVLSITSNLLRLLAKKEHLKIDKGVQRADSEVLVDAGNFGFLLVCYALARLIGFGVLTNHVKVDITRLAARQRAFNARH